MARDDSEEELSDLVSVCSSHFIYDETQSQIAAKLGVSRAKVCKMIAKAKAKGIFSIQINDPINHVRNLSARLMKIYGLRDAVVVPIPKFGAKSVKERLGITAAETLAGLLRDNDIIGVSGGSTLYEMLVNLENVNIRNGTIVPLLGGYAETERSTRGTEIAYCLAERLRARIINMPVPGLAQSSEEAAIFCANPIVRKSIDWMHRCSVAAFGIGSAGKDSSFYRGGFLNDELLSELAKEEAVGCIGFNFFKIDGTPCGKFNSKIIGMPLDVLEHIPLTLGVAGGSPNKVPSLIGAMTGGYLNTLVTDQVTAEQILAYDASSNK